MRLYWMALLLPVLAGAQEFQFQQEYNTIPVNMSGWSVMAPWAWGFSQSVASLGDVNGDGDNDMIIGDFQGNLFYYFNQGTPPYPAFTFCSTNFDSVCLPYYYITAPCLTDADADGDLDLFLETGGWLKYFENVGGPEVPDYILQIDSLVPSTFDVLNVDLADIDADGDFDLFTGAYTGTISLLRNLGSPQVFNFQVETTYLDSIDVGNRAHPEFGDLDADGDLDLVVGNQDGRLSYYRNDGTPQQYQFTLVSSYWLSLDVGAYASPEFCDIDGDGDLDLFVGREINYSNPTNGDVFFYENIGTPAAYNFQFITSNYLTLDVGYTACQQLVDIDADSDLDLFVSTGNVVRFFRNTGTPSAPTFLLESDAYEGIAVQDLVPCFADIDGDGDLDLLAGSSAIPGPPGIYLFQNRGTPQQAQFVLASSNFVPGNYFVMVAPTLADIDADGDLDLFVTDQENTGTIDIWYFQNNGSAQWPNFQLVTQNWQGIYIAFGIQRYLRFHDIDGDEDLDLFFYNEGNEPGGDNLRFYENIGTPQSPQMTLVTTAWLTQEARMACPDFCDIDADSCTDLFVGDSYGGVLFFHGLADTSGWVLPPVQRHPLAGLQISLGPNPANPLTVISFSLPFAQQIDLAVYNLLGARITTLASGLKLPGSYVIPWDASGNASGVYIIRLETPVESLSEKLTIVK